MKRLSKGFYLGSVVAGGGLGIILLMVGEATMEIGVTLFSLIPLVYAVIVGLVLFYRAWASIQDGFARTTPGKAIGFLFIPFFNIYWTFQAWWGFAKDYNSYVARHEVSTSRLPEGLFLSLCILSIVSGVLVEVPFLGYALLIASFVIEIMVINKTCDAVNSLP